MKTKMDQAVEMVCTSEEHITEVNALAAGEQIQGISNSDVGNVSSTIEVGQQPANEPVSSNQADEPNKAQKDDEHSADILRRKPRSYPEHLDDWPADPDICRVADEMTELFDRHCIISREEVHAMVLWIIASYSINAYQIFPKLTLVSPEMRCGKSTALSLVTALCRDGVQTAHISPAAIFRLCSENQPTLLIDEADTFVKGASPDLIGLINSGHNQSTSTIIRCDGESHEPRAFSTWMPMALASIGDLSATIMDRSIVIRLRRAKPSEKVSRMPVDVLDKLQPIRRQLNTWAKGNFQAAQEHPIEPPDIGNTRAADNWLPLFTSANLMSEYWLERVTHAYSSLNEPSEPTLATQLLRDIRCILEQAKEDRVATANILRELCAIEESPWATLNNGRPLSPNTLANILRPFGIKPRASRKGEKTRRGYDKQQFADTFERYL